jgi:hypothetical protein
MELYSAALILTSCDELRAMLRWFRSCGEFVRVGLESTGTNGAGIARYIALAGIPVREVTGLYRTLRCAKGKDDELGAIAGAKSH